MQNSTNSSTVPIRRHKRNNEQETHSNQEILANKNKRKRFISIFQCPKHYSIVTLAFLSLIFMFQQSKWNNNTPLYSIASKSETKNQQDNQQDDPPLYFIMHMGPPKTGSTTMQCSLRYLQDQNLLPSNIYIMKKSFHIDGCGSLNFKSKEKGPITNYMRNCIGKWDHKLGGTMPKCWYKKYMNYIKIQMKLNKSIFIIEETLSWFPDFILQSDDEDEARAQKFLQDFVSSIDSRYKVIIVVSYRNYIDWIFSYYTQKSKRLIHEKNNWNSPFINTPETYLAANTLRNHYSDYVYNFFVKGLLGGSTELQSRVSLKVLNMENTNILHEFLCNIVPSSLNLCQFIPTMSKLDTSNTSPNYLLCDALTTSLKTNGYLKDTSKRSRFEIYSTIKKYIESKKGSCQELQPKLCPSKLFYDNLLNVSMEYHMNLFYKNNLLDGISSNDKENKMDALRRFYKLKLDKSRLRFCTINSTAFVLDKKWNDLLLSITT